MRLSTQAYAQLYGVQVANTDRSETHLSLDLLRDLVKSGKPLDAYQRRHTGQCRDCRDFVEDFSTEARRAGKSVPDLLLKSVRAAASPR